MTVIDPGKLEGLRLDKGAHASPHDGMCVMEAAAWLRGDVEFTDHPRCVSPVLGDFLRPYNDALDDETRQRLIHFIPRLLDTAGDAALDKVRRQMVWDWVLDTWLPTWLRLAGLDDAATLVSTNRDLESLQSAATQADAAWDSAGAAAWDAAGDAAWDAAWAAARDAAWAAAWDVDRDAAWAAARDAARDAAWAAAWAAARDVARDAAGAAARDVARDAAGDALRPTVLALQESAFELIDRMIDAPHMGEAMP